jgi:hypothetical protein
MSRLTEADLFERDLFGTTPRRLQAAQRARARDSWNGHESAELDVEHPERQKPTPPTPAPAPAPTPGPTPVTGSSVVLKRTQVRLPTLGEEFEISKILDTATDTPSTRATNTAGAPIDSQRKLADETRAYLRRHRQIHPALSRAMSQAGSNRIPVVIWLYVDEEIYDKGADREGPAVAGPRVASTEAMMVDPRLRTEPPPDQPPEPRMIGYRRQVDAVVEQAMRQLPETTGVRVNFRVGAVPALIVDATPAQVRRLSARPEVAGLFLYEPIGILDLDNSMKVARAKATVASGFKGTGVKVAVWEPGPDVLTDLRVEAFFDPAVTGTSNHARLVTAIIKNRQSSGEHGYAPNARTFSANSFDIKALNWAIVTKECSVINQSFHDASEETSGALSAEDLIKDYYATHYPFPTVVLASGNQTTTGVEFVNHKGYNTIVVGSHNDSADRMAASSVFRNPTSPHLDRELPEVCANGEAVTAAGHTDSGTSFASPAVAGSVAVIQRVAQRLKVWPEGCRAVIMAGAGRNVRGKTWWDDVRRRVDGRDGAGALDTRESVRIARKPSPRNGAAARRGWDVGTLRSTDFAANGRSTFKYQVEVPESGSSKHIRVALAWSSKVTYVDDPTQTPPIKNVVSTLTTDLDLHLYEGSRLVDWSSSFDNSYEIIDFEGKPGTTYDIVIRRWSGNDWVWFGIAWSVF